MQLLRLTTVVRRLALTAALVTRSRAHVARLSTACCTAHTQPHPHQQPPQSSMPPKAGSNVAAAACVPKPLMEDDPHTIREGLAIIKRPPKEEAAAASAASAEATEEVDEEGQKVFYNKVQVFNRDLSILMIKTFVAEREAEFDAKRAKQVARKAANEAAAAEAVAAGRPVPAALMPESNNAYVAPTVFPGITILEALSATGLRSVRYFKEIPHVTSIIVNDMDAEAVKSIEYNIELNGLTTEQLIPSHSDAITLLQKYRPPVMGPSTLARPSVVDLDPYGTAAPFLDSAVQAVDEGGLLCITCTDKAILCGNYSETCWAKYGSMPLKGSFCHETAIRLVLNCISSACHRYGRHMVPMLSMSIDFYVRVFVRVYSSPLVVKKQAANMGMILECVGCESFWHHAMGKIKQEGNSTKHTPNTIEAPLAAGSRCPECASTIKMGGPFWLGPLHNKAFVAKALASVQADPTKFATAPRIIGSLTVCGDELQAGEERMMVDRKSLNQARLAAEAAKSAAAASNTSAEAAPAAASSSPAKDEGLSSILYYSLPHLFQIVNLSCPKIAVFRSALINAGYQVSQSHSSHNALKTTAPNNVVWDLIRCWALEHPPKHGQKAGSVGERIMAKAPVIKADWTLVKGTDLSAMATGVAKFLPNPEEHWGPKARAGSKRKAAVDPDQAKRQRLNQNKRCRTRQCKLFADTGSCKFDTLCKYAHVPGVAAGVDVTGRLKESLSNGGETEEPTSEKMDEQ